MSFTVTLATVLVMLAYAIPGYLLMRARLVPQSGIAGLAAVLMYVCAPMQSLYAIQQISRSPYILAHLALSFGLGLFLMGSMMALVYFLLRKKQSEVPYRICSVAVSMGNFGFLGLPLIQALLPEYPQGVAFASAFFFSMNLLIWTVTAFIMTRDRKYIRLRKIFLNPNTIAMTVALILMFSDIHITGQLGDMIALLGRMTTPVCMLILGMRLALIPFKPMFTSPVQYLAVGLRLVAFPLVTLAVVRLLPLEREYAQFIYILSCVPVGTLVLSMAELIGECQDVAANVVLLSTLLSVISIPVMLLLV